MPTVTITLLRDQQNYLDVTGRCYSTSHMTVHSVPCCYNGALTACWRLSWLEVSQWPQHTAPHWVLSQSATGVCLLQCVPHTQWATVFPHCNHSVTLQNIPCPSDIETSPTNLQCPLTLNASMLHAVKNSSDLRPAATSIAALYITQKFPQNCSYTLYIDNDHNGNVHKDISDCSTHR